MRFGLARKCGAKPPFIFLARTSSPPRKAVTIRTGIATFLGPASPGHIYAEMLHPRMMHAIHRYDFHLFQLVTDGAPVQMVDFEPVHCSPGSFLVLQPGQVHSFGPSLDWNGWLIAFRAEFLQKEPGEMSQGQALDLLPSHQHLSASHLTVRDMILAMAADARMDHENPAASAMHPDPVSSAFQQWIKARREKPDRSAAAV